MVGNHQKIYELGTNRKTRNKRKESEKNQWKNSKGSGGIIILTTIILLKNKHISTLVKPFQVALNKDIIGQEIFNCALHQCNVQLNNNKTPNKTMIIATHNNSLIIGTK